jgi:hypothetical protein
MSSMRWRGGVVGLGLLAGGGLAAAGASAQTAAAWAPAATVGQAAQGGPRVVLPLGTLPSPQVGIGDAGLASGSDMTTLTAKQLVRMSSQELDGIYQRSAMAPIPPGEARGRAVVSPGSRIAGPASGVAGLVWQGKVFRADGRSAVNKFFGLRVIKADVSAGESWMDGGPALILDYSRTSFFYRPYRDEIRLVAPGLFLGLMYERTCPRPTFKMYFVLETACGR